MPTVVKDPADVIDYGLRFTSLDLAGNQDALQVGAWRVEGADTSLQVVDAGGGARGPAVNGDVASVWLTGGTPGITYDVVCTATTSQGRVTERTLRVVVRDQ